MKEEIHKTNLRKKPSWMNTDSTKWQDKNSGYWQVAKCYLNTPGYLDNTGPNEIGLRTYKHLYEQFTNFDVKKSLNEIEGSIYDRLQKELEEIIDEKVERKVKQEMRNFSYDRSNDGKEQQNLQKQLANYYQNQLNSASISPLISDKAERLDMFYVPPKIVEKDHRKVGATKEENGTHVTSYRQMFCKTGKLRKNVFIVGEAGMGKSTCAAMCALKWANQISPTNTINEHDTNDTHQTS
ncbi:hypothetical protein MAR_002982, partial [Mya arenaria]